MVCEGNYFFPISINYHYYVLQKNKPNNTILSLRKIINVSVNFNVICYYSKDVVPSFIRSISHKYYSTLSPLHAPMEEHDNKIDEKNQREIIELYRSVEIGT